jgi:hypothetical protein
MWHCRIVANARLIGDRGANQHVNEHAIGDGLRGAADEIACSLGGTADLM